MEDKYGKYQAVIGLEIHAQLSTLSKAYSGDATAYGAAPNTQLSTITLAHPGTLPKLNKKAAEFAIKVGLATHCNIRKYNQFARKNYFYADLPKGYQISQFDTPICYDGFVEIKINETSKKIRLERIHMEEDSGKSIHELDPFNTLIDLNRAGIPLIEIVTRPDISSADEAMAFLTKVRQLVRYLEICDGNMEEGSLRCDANISVNLKTTTEYGKKVEVKNMNSIRNVGRAIDYEIKRQIDTLEEGGIIEQETRNFDANNGKTAAMRSKEMAHDYRYFPEPDLPPLVLSDAYIEQIKQNMPPLAEELKSKFIEDFGLSAYDAELLTEDKYISLYYLDIIEKTKDYKSAANWMNGPVKAYLNAQAIDIKQFPLGTQHIVDLIDLIQSGKTNFSTASTKIFPVLIEQPNKNAESIAQQLNLIQVSDENSIAPIIDAVLIDFSEKVTEYKNGKTGLMGLFVGEVMKRSAGKADPKLTSQMLAKRLAEC